MSESISPTPEPFADLKVPDEPGVWYCAKHKSVTTRLRCGRCEKPICPKCTVMAPTGARCGDCASNRSSHIYQAKPHHLVLAVAIGLGVGALGGLLVGGGMFIAIWLLLYGYAIGPALGKVIVRASGGKRGPVLAGAVCGGLIFGTIGVRVGAEISRMRIEAVMPPEAAVYYAFDPMTWAMAGLFLLVSVSSTWWYLK